MSFIKDVNDSPINLKINISQAPIEVEQQVDDLSFSPNDFIPEEILNDNASSKTITILGYLKSDRQDQSGDNKAKKALVILNKSPFTEESAYGLLTSRDTKHDLELCNDVYRMYITESQPRFNSTKMTLIYPASENHIKKYKRQEVISFNETATVYNEHVKPFLAEGQLSLEWVYNILEGKKEVDRVIYRSNDDPNVDFLLLPDLKWSGLQMEDLYVMALVERKDIKSIRDLTDVHLPLLKFILSKGKEILENKYNLPKNKLRVYVHYQPSYYHFHVHFTHVRFDAPGFGADKAHLLTEIIDNLERNGSHYKECLLSYTLKQESSLYNYLNDLKVI